MDDASHRLALQPFSQALQLAHHGANHRLGIKDINGHEIIRRHHRAQRQILVAAIAENAAGETLAGAGRGHDADAVGAAMGDAADEGEPGLQGHRWLGCLHQRIDEPRLRRPERRDLEFLHDVNRWL